MPSSLPQIRSVRPDESLLLASIPGHQVIPNHFVEAAFWWEYLRSSPEAVAAIQRTLTPTYWPRRDRSLVARVVHPGLLLVLGPGLKNHFGRKVFPQMSWMEAMQTRSIPRDEYPIFSAADLWAEQIDFAKPRAVELTSFPKHDLDDDDSESKRRQWGEHKNYHIEVNWEFTDKQVTQSFKEELVRLRPKNSPTPRVPYKSTLNKTILPVRPRSALGWLYILRARATCSSWRSFNEHYKKEICNVVHSMPAEQELMSRCRRARQIIGWLRTGVIAHME